MGCIKVDDKLRDHSNLTHVQTHEHKNEDYGLHINKKNMFKILK